MLPGYEDLEPTMDAQVETRLGDSISYTRAGASPVTIRGFINLESDEGAIEGADPIRKRWIVIINRSRLPGGPVSTDRISHPKLGMVMKPSTSTVTGDGRDWVFGLQKA